jgi:hypothetical protein
MSGPGAGGRSLTGDNEARMWIHPGGRLLSILPGKAYGLESLLVR